MTSPREVLQDVMGGRLAVLREALELDAVLRLLVADEHAGMEAGTTRQRCVYCGWESPLSTIPSHLGDCPVIRGRALLKEPR